MDRYKDHAAAVAEVGFDCALTAVVGFNDTRTEIMALRRYFTEPDATKLVVRMSGFRELIRSRSISPDRRQTS